MKLPRETLKRLIGSDWRVFVAAALDGGGEVGEDHDHA
jgi:hypothetical protein